MPFEHNGRFRAAYPGGLNRFVSELSPQTVNSICLQRYDRLPFRAGELWLLNKHTSLVPSFLVLGYYCRHIHAICHTSTLPTPEDMMTFSFAVQATPLSERFRRHPRSLRRSSLREPQVAQSLKCHHDLRCCFQS